MKRPTSACWQFLKYLAYLIGATLLCAYLLSTVLTHAAEDSPALPAWATPNVMAMRRVSDIPSAQHTPNFLSNLDCSLLTYRLRGNSTMQTGCFTEAAFGMLDSDSETAIFLGTDEGLPLLPYSSHEALVPWPEAGAMIALDATDTGGSYISLYRNPLAFLRDQRNELQQLIAKQFVKPPDLPLTDSSGKRLIINPQTMAFSDNGSWLAVETLSGSFVRINLATLDITAFAPSFGSQGSPALLKSQVAISSNGRYVAIGNKDAGSLKVYDLANCGTGAIGLQPQTCAAHDYQSFVAGQITGFQAVRGLRFINDSLLSLEVQTNDPTSSGVYELAPEGSIRSLINYLALGDSYTSGEGAFDYLAGTDTADDMCHLSAHSYPQLLTHDLFSASGGHSVACSGAEINDVGSASLNYKGQVRGAGTFQQLQQTQATLLSTIMTDYLPGYVAQERFVRQYQPDITTVSIGGNDIGFGSILQKCVIPHISLHSGDNTCYSSYEDRLELTNLIDRTVARWTVLYKQLLAEAPGTRLYVIGYPQITYDKGNCAQNVHLDKSELEFSEELTDYLNTSIKQAATAAGVRYVDISQALAGHRLCEAASYDVAANGLTAGTDGGPFGLRIFGKESYHPNALGQALIEQAILKQTNNLTSSTVSGLSPAAQDILNAPKTGRPINTLIPDNSLTSGVAQAGKSVTVQASGTRDGLIPQTVYIIRLDGASGPVLASITSDEDGDISTSTTMPENTAPGEHTIDITGTNQTDEPVDITQPIYIPFSDNDADGDNIPDSLDTCPGAINSGQDSDEDGVDDACDDLIGSLSPSGGQTGSGGSNGDVSVQATTVTDDSSTSGTGLSDEQPRSVVATFTTSPDQSSSVERAVGALTLNPSNMPKGLELPHAKAFTNNNKSFAKLPVIDWVIWLVILIIFWLIILVGLSVKRLADNVSRSTGFPAT